MGTVTRVHQEDIGLSERIVADFTFGASYTTGGEEITTELLGGRAGEVIDVQPSILDASAAANLFQWDPTTKKLKALDTALAEIAAATDLSAVTVRIEAIVGQAN